MSEGITHGRNASIWVDLQKPVFLLLILGQSDGVHFVLNAKLFANDVGLPPEGCVVVSARCQHGDQYGPIRYSQSSTAETEKRGTYPLGVPAVYKVIPLLGDMVARTAKLGRRALPAAKLRECWHACQCLTRSLATISKL